MNTITLTPAQIAEFNEQGFLILPGVFNAAELAAMASEANRLLELAINSSLATGERNPRCDVSVNSRGTLDFRKLQPVNDLSDVICRASQDARLVGPLRQLMGDHEPILMEEKLNYKQTIDCPAFIEKFHPHQGDARFNLHHDWGYYRAQGYPPETLSSAVTIDETTPENGPIRVLPGTHLKDFPLKNPDPAGGNGEVVDGLFEPDDRVDVLAPAGSVMLFHSRLLHDSKPNTTGRPRRLMIYSHYPGNWHFEEDKRNRWGREAGQRVEAAYFEKVQSGDYRNLFEL
ncbi:MAG: phytanoyl-CoA dioxygenase family protein [Armatimonadota bacterium]|nr:phytanoyl-CoA dioxygenase family protein [Armatimonadota bacterium]